MNYKQVTSNNELQTKLTKCKFKVFFLKSEVFTSKYSNNLFTCLKFILQHQQSCRMGKAEVTAVKLASRGYFGF